MAAYKWETNGKDLLEVQRTEGYQIFRGSYLDERINEVDFYPENMRYSYWSFVIGIITDEHDIKPGIWLAQSRHGWGVTFNSKGSYKVHQTAVANTSYRKDIAGFTSIRMIYDKEKGELSFIFRYKDNRKPILGGVAFSGIPESPRIRIAVSISSYNINETRSCLIKNPRAGMKTEEARKDNQERICFLMEEIDTYYFNEEEEKKNVIFEIKLSDSGNSLFGLKLLFR